MFSKNELAVAGNRYYNLIMIVKIICNMLDYGFIVHFVRANTTFEETRKKKEKHSTENRNLNNWFFQFHLAF